MQIDLEKRQIREKLYLSSCPKIRIISVYNWDFVFSSKKNNMNMCLCLFLRKLMNYTNSCTDDYFLVSV